MALKQTEQPPTQERFAEIVEALVHSPGVTFGSDNKKAFGSSALKVHDKIFAMIDSKGRFVVKLPKARVDILVATNQGDRFDPGHGRVMKEWLAVAPAAEDDWLSLAQEALAFVSAQR